MDDFKGEKIVAAVELPHVHDGGPCCWLLSSGRFAHRFTDDRRTTVDEWISEHGDEFRDYWIGRGGTS